MGAVQIYGSPVDKKRYRKMAVVSVPFTLNASEGKLIDITGLSFKPRYIICVDDYTSNLTRYFDRTDFQNLTGSTAIIADENYQASPNSQLTLGIGRANVFDTYFRVFLQNTGTYKSGTLKLIILGW